MPSTSNVATISLGVVILAAGASSRMGRPKMLLPWGQTSVLGHLFDQWRGLGAAQIAVVCAAGDDLVDGELDRLSVPTQQRVFNPAPEQGMFSSIQCAARWAGWRPDLTHWVIVLGDQPHLPAATLRALLAFAASHAQKICQPERQGRPRHPVCLPKAVFAQLAAAAEPDLKTFLANRSALRGLCPLTDPALDLDMDTPADYDRIAPKPIRNRRGLAALFAASLSFLLVHGQALGGEAAAHEWVAPGEVQLQGRVVCLLEETNPVTSVHRTGRHEHQWGFRTDDGKYYRLRRTRYSEALFLDARLRQKELLLKGRLSDPARVFDVTRMRSIRNGLVCDLYYYCRVCSIKTIVPGPCMCCQQPVELVEQPLAGSHLDI